MLPSTSHRLIEETALIEVGISICSLCNSENAALFMQGKDILAAREQAGRSKHMSHSGRVCATVLIKLLLDLWSLNDAAVSFPLALILLNG